MKAQHEDLSPIPEYDGITIIPHKTDDIDDIVKKMRDAYEDATDNKDQLPVHALHNGVELVFKGKTKSDDLIRKYNTKLREQSIGERPEPIELSPNKIEAKLNKLDYSNYGQLVEFLIKLSELDLSETPFVPKQFVAIFDRFKKEGFNPIYEMQDPPFPVDKENKESYARYLIGVAIAELRTPATKKIHVITARGLADWQRKYISN